MASFLSGSSDESIVSGLQTNRSKQLTAMAAAIPTPTSATGVPQTFSLIALKSIANNSHAMSSAHNPNKLVKIHSDCFDASLLNGKTTSVSPKAYITSENIRNNNNLESVIAIANKASSMDSASIKANLPNLGTFPNAFPTIQLLLTLSNRF